MNTEDRLDDLIRDRLRAAAPSEAPARVLEATMTRISDTSQRGRGWLGGTAGRMLAAAAVLLVAIVAGTQLTGLIDRPVGTDPSPSTPVGPSSNATAAPSEASAAAEDGLLLRIVSAGGGPSNPSQIMPTTTLMADGTLIWQRIPPPTETGSLVTRTLTAEGLAALRERIFGTGLFEASATHELERRPGAPEPPGRGVGIYLFTAGEGDDEVVVRSVQWLGDEEESTYYEPSPERRELDALAQELRDPESLVAADAWTGPAEPYEGADYQLLLIPYRDVPAHDTTDASEIPWPFDVALDAFGEVSGVGIPPARCGVLGRDEAVAIMEALAERGYSQVGLDRATVGSLDWAAGNGTVDFFIIPRLPDGYPDCADHG